MLGRRQSGILLHITSLPSPYGIGDLGLEAYRFVDFLKEVKQTIWQILPIHPTDAACDYSPYSSPSAFAGNVLLISPEILVEDGWLDEKPATEHFAVFPPEKVPFDAVSTFKNEILEKAFQNFLKKTKEKEDFSRFRSENAFWLEDYALYVALKQHYHGRPWYEWEPGVRDRELPILEDHRKKFERQILKEEFLQYLFFQQWRRLKEYCRRQGITLMGDIPIYVSYDSADVWVFPENYKLTSEKKLQYCAGVPPDYFSETGQLWGNPVYDWQRMKEEKFSWWLKRLAHNLSFFDILRIDHFRGLVAYWEVPAGEKTAVHGHWEQAPVDDFFDAVKQRFPDLPFVAEDLGVITEDVRETMRKYNIPGMKVLLFAFGEDLKKHPYLPHNYSENCVAYTGTHDNNTARGWFDKEATAKEKENVWYYFKRKISGEDFPWACIDLLMSSKANTVIFPMQDILGCGEEARMNKPATRNGNWRWRLKKGEIKQALISRLQEITQKTQRYH